MKKQQVDHVLRAAGGITGEKQFIIIGAPKDGRDPAGQSHLHDFRAERDLNFTDRGDDREAIKPRARAKRGK